ncbi:MAG TPA: DUF3710 domain-containing protein [Mycobacteriales bacterium]|nr:DUF3710 domain-containing protein [Mycobacteriales bacterium]
MFRRRRATDDVADDEYDDDFDENESDADDDAGEHDESREQPRQEVVERITTGPWDVAHLPKEDETPRVDLGGLLVPIHDGVELRVEVQDDVVVGAALFDGNSQLIVSAFAAPKSSGIWDDVRTEIADSLKGTGGGGEHIEGAFGTELRARIPDETGGTQAARFIGVDGPRWFLRGLLSGPAATDNSQARRLEAVFRDIVVNRGGDAMAPRDPLPLHLPREAFEAVAAAEADDDNDELHLQLQERGPEITEIR